MGETLLKHVVEKNVEFGLVPSYENKLWSIMEIFFIFLLAICVVLATCFFTRRLGLRRVGHHLCVREFHGMSGRLVKSLILVVDADYTFETYAIGLEEYKVGEKHDEFMLRELGKQ
jgi:E3 ubiquitin-protein ligase RNF13